MPDGQKGKRYWDGERWTGLVRGGSRPSQQPGKTRVSNLGRLFKQMSVPARAIAAVATSLVVIGLLFLVFLGTFQAVQAINLSIRVENLKTQVAERDKALADAGVALADAQALNAQAVLWPDRQDLRAQLESQMSVLSAEMQLRVTSRVVSATYDLRNAKDSLGTQAQAEARVRTAQEQAAAEAAAQEAEAAAQEAEAAAQAQLQAKINRFQAMADSWGVTCSYRYGGGINFASTFLREEGDSIYFTMTADFRRFPPFSLRVYPWEDRLGSGLVGLMNGSEPAECVDLNYLDYTK